jgi:hypothetical protein
MKRFTDAIAKALADKNWLAAVALSLTMPDVCGGMEHPNDGSEKRYRAWWDKYMLKHYPRLSSADAYALRCAYLHEGGLHQRARKALTQNHFVVPKEGVLPRRHSARKVRNMVASSMSCGGRSISRQLLRKLPNKICHLSLGGNAGFTESFLDCLRF